jgi:DNA-binding response OmpR family regulator
MKILVLEDDKFLSEAYNLKLRSAGHEVLMVGEIGEAQKLLEDFLPDLIILDLILPDSYGLDFLEWLKGKAEYKNVMVMVVTNVDKTADKEKALKFGLVGYYCKTEKSLEQILEEVGKLSPKATRG